MANVDSFVAYDFALNRFGVSRDYAEGGVALLSAGAGASDVVVRAPAAAPITANPELLPTVSIPDSMKAGCATEGCATVGYRVAESKIPGKVTFADPKFRSVDAGIPWCATTVVGHSAGPWGGYFEVDLDCHSIAMVEFWLGGDSKVASSSNRNVVAREMTSFVDAALQTFWALPATAAPVEKTRKSENQLGAQVGAQIVSNGLYFDKRRSGRVGVVALTGLTAARSHSTVGTGSMARNLGSHRDDKTKLMKLSPDEFLRRFLQHVQPRGFHRVRACSTGAFTLAATYVASP